MVVFIFRRKLKFIYSSIIFLFIFSNGITSETLWRVLEHPWERLNYADISSSDGIVVLSGGRHLPPGDTKIIEWNDPDRFISGINLYRANKSEKLIFTGGINPLNPTLPPEGDIYMEEAFLMGIPKKDLFTTRPVFNTFEEAKAIKKLLDKEKNFEQKKIILVTSAFHMKRAKKIFEREGINVLPYPDDFKKSKNLISELRNPLIWIPSSYYFNRSSEAIRELIGRIVYKSW